MNNKRSIAELRELCANAESFSRPILDWIENENLWNLWVPRAYGGRESNLTEGLKALRQLAQIDGSLGWTVTLCSGANYFIGNLAEEAASAIFENPKKPVCFGGSGSIAGTAEKTGDHYIISGKWRYATGASYLTHFTLNAKITKNGKDITEKDGSPRFRSFIIPRNEVEIIPDWDTMGLRATVTHSFKVRKVHVHEKFSFRYDQCYLPQPIFKVPFAVFADLTLWVNYIGMAAHLLEEAETILSKKELEDLTGAIALADDKIRLFTAKIEGKAAKNSTFSTSLKAEVHHRASDSVRHLSRQIISVFPKLGIRAATHPSYLNMIFRDYFTATQHHIFVK